jgi:hypothetical protein
MGKRRSGGVLKGAAPEIFLDFVLGKVAFYLNLSYNIYIFLIESLTKVQILVSSINLKLKLL